MDQARYLITSKTVSFTLTTALVKTKTRTKDPKSLLLDHFKNYFIYPYTAFICKQKLVSKIRKVCPERRKINESAGLDRNKKLLINAKF